MLTTGLDNAVGTSADDVFVGGVDDTVGSTVNTLSVLDAINGGAGKDTLKIAHAKGEILVPSMTSIEVIEVQSVALTGTVEVSTSAIAGVEQLNVTKAVSDVDVTAAATTNVSAKSETKATVEGGLNVTATADEVVIDKAAGAVTATAAGTKGTVTIGGTTAVKGAVTANATGEINVKGGTVLDLTTKGGVSTGQQAANVTAATDAAAALATATTAVGTATTAKTAAEDNVTKLTALSTALSAATVAADVAAAVTAAGAALTGSQGSMIKTAFAAGLTTSVTAAKAAAAAVVAPIATAAAAAVTKATADVVAATAVETTATASKEAADKVVADGVQANATAEGDKMTAVNVSNSDVVSITDTSDKGTLTAVTLNNTGVATLTGKALTSVSLTNVVDSDVTIVNATAAHAQTVTLNKVNGTKVVDADATTLNVVTSGAASAKVTLEAAKATALNVSGDQNFSATAITAGSVKTANITSTGSFTADLTTLHADAVIKADTSTGANTVTILETQSYAGGTGVDTVTLTKAATKAVNGGDGTADVLVVNDAAGFVANAKVTGFEILAVGKANAAKNDATGFTALHVGGETAAGVSFDNVAAGTALTIAAATVNGVKYVLKDATGKTDAMALTVGTATTKGINAGTVDAAGIEAQTVKSLGTGTGTGTVANEVTITNKATSLVVEGSHAIKIAGLADKTVKTIDLTAATKMVDVSSITVDITGVTATAGAGGAKITGGDGKDTLTGGAGADTLNGGKGADVIVGNGGKDVITGGTGADDITISGGMNKLVFEIGDSGANKTTNTQTTALTTGFDVIKGAMAGDTIQLGDGTSGYGFGDVIAKGTNLAGVDNKVVFVRGSFDSAAGIFSYAANGADTLMTADTESLATTPTSLNVAFDSIVLVGFVAGDNTSAALGVITLA